MTIFYTAVQVGIYFWCVFTFPGYVNDGSDQKYLTWYSNLFEKYMLNIAHSLWLGINILASAVTIYAIRSIFDTVNRLTNGNGSLALNKGTLILHSSLLVVQTVVVALNALPPKLTAPFYYKLVIALVTMDFFVELAICYICWTMGSSL